MLMSSVCKLVSFWREASAGRREEQGVQRQLTSSKGPERMGYWPPWTRDCLPSKGIFFLVSFFNKDAPAHNICVCKIKKIILCEG
jgi:hypothetical protein